MNPNAHGNIIIYLQSDKMIGLSYFYKSKDEIRRTFTEKRELNSEDNALLKWGQFYEDIYTEKPNSIFS